MAWMFAGTEQDLMVGVHFHQHNQLIPPHPLPLPPIPMIPSFHPSLGPLRDKLAGTVMVDNRKAAKTGTTAKILILPHLPIIYFAGLGPMMHVTAKDGTGQDQIFMGAGIGAHPFGGLMFVVVEGKPGAGMLSLALACMCVGGSDMMLPGIVNLLLIPTRGPTVLYGPAPLAIDLLVLLVAMLENLLDFLCEKLHLEGLVKDIVKAAGGALIKGVETFCEAKFERDPPATTAEAFQEAGRATAYTFVNNMVDVAYKNTVGKVMDNVGKGMGGNPATAVLWNAFGGDANKAVKGEFKDLAGKGMDAVTGGDFGKFNKEEAEKAKAGKATAPDPLGPISDNLGKFGEMSNKAAGDIVKEDKANQKAIDAAKKSGDPEALKKAEEKRAESQNVGGAFVNNMAEDFSKDKQKEAGHEMLAGDEKKKEGGEGGEGEGGAKKVLPAGDAHDKAQGILGAQDKHEQGLLMAGGPGDAGAPVMENMLA